MKQSSEAKSKLGKYWEKHILSWEESAYFNTITKTSRLHIWDRLSRFFRGDSMYRRMNAAIELLKPVISGKTIIDIGCASGIFALKLCDLGAKKVIGVDISRSAIERAYNICKASPHADKVEFIAADVTDPGTKLPGGEIITALGVIEYFNLEALANFFRIMSAPLFFFGFPLKTTGTPTLRRTLRKIYLAMNRGPEVYEYSVEEFNNIALQCSKKPGVLKYKDKHCYITNIV